MTRFCVCGKAIYRNKTLCEDCVKKYSLDRSTWEPWLLEWVQSYQKEIDHDRRHRHLPVYEETETGSKVFMSSDAVQNLNRAMDNPEMEFEDFIWDNV